MHSQGMSLVRQEVGNWKLYIPGQPEVFLTDSRVAALGELVSQAMPPKRTEAEQASESEEAAQPQPEAEAASETEEAQPAPETEQASPKAKGKKK